MCYGKVEQPMTTQICNLCILCNVPVLLRERIKYGVLELNEI